MYNRILVAVDGSDTANLALKEAIKLAKDQHSALPLVHVVDLSPAYSDPAAHTSSSIRKRWRLGAKR